MNGVVVAITRYHQLMIHVIGAANATEGKSSQLFINCVIKKALLYLNEGIKISGIQRIVCVFQ